MYVSWILRFEEFSYLSNLATPKYVDTVKQSNFVVVRNSLYKTDGFFCKLGNIFLW